MTIGTNDARGAVTTPKHVVLKMLIASTVLTAMALTLAAVFH